MWLRKYNRWLLAGLRLWGCLAAVCLARDARAGTTVSVPLTPTLSTSVTSTGICVGDCDGNGEVTVDDLLTLVNVALGDAELSLCQYGVPSGAEVDIALILQAVNNALNGCGDG